MDQKLMQDLTLSLSELLSISARYSELIMSVERKFTGEDRHATARRYIEEAEAAEKRVGPAQEEKIN